MRHLIGPQVASNRKVVKVIIKMQKVYFLIAIHIVFILCILLILVIIII